LNTLLFSWLLNKSNKYDPKKPESPDNHNIVNDIDAVVTISGVVQGLKALEGGLPALKKTATKKINIAWNGLVAAIGVFDFSSGINIIPLLLRNQGGNFVDLISWIISPFFDPYYLEALRGAKTSEFEQINDMVPGSAYITENVVEKTKYTYKVTWKIPWPQLRYKKVLGISIGYFGIGYKDVHKYYTSYYPQAKFDENVPVGFIVGGNNRTLSMADGGGKEAYKWCKGFEIGFGVVEAYHIVRCAFIVGLFSNNTVYAYDADRARRLMRNIDTELHDIVGSSKGDGLVALSHQHIPQAMKMPDGKTVTALKNPFLGYEYFGDYSHNNIQKQAKVYKKAGEMVKRGEAKREEQIQKGIIKR
jgi:hypothetical protein